ncbi:MULTISPECIES: hypothetical protein [Paenibacillus]|uniref:Uncharacterized protein n=2 Tax=Paenibacillus TaxID=44249 RepID=A0A5S5C2Q1_9BACL|nr:hypothetical protein [Paenibacillus methanolicus]TYP72610.1 hypothetical protein BCM02_108265 [Paenibacillus methanolicus]
MILVFTCECGNRVDFHAFGDRDEHGRQWLESEDDDRLTLRRGEDGVVFACTFCKETYRLQAEK